jgi:hypothetical protein
MQRYAPTRITLALLVILTSCLSFLPLAAPVQAAVGDHGASFTGYRPNPNPGEFDLHSEFAVPYSAELNTLTSLTLEAWVYRSENGAVETIIGNGRNSSYWLGLSSLGLVQYTPRGAANIVASQSTIPRETWTHVAVTQTGAGLVTFYINGQLNKTVSTVALNNSPNPRTLGIGADLTDDFDKNYFGGILDNVRIWQGARGPNEIKSGLFQVYAADTPKLLAEWRFDGNGSETTGQHPGNPGNVTFVNAGALPRDLRIPQVAGGPFTPTASCNYNAATEVTLAGASVQLLRTATDLHICIDGLAGGTAELSLDRAFDRADKPQPDDVRLEIAPDGARKAYLGTGTGYTPTTTLDAQWDAKYLNCCGEFPTDRAEFRVSLAMLEGASHFGMALSRRTLTGGNIVIPIRRLWPALARDAQPVTWSAVSLGGLGAQRTINGQVRYKLPGNAAPLVVGNVRALLIGSDNNGSEALLDSAESSAATGNWSLSTTSDYPNLRVELDRASLPRGSQPYAASAPQGGEVIDPRTVFYPNLPAGSYNGNIFTLNDLAPFAMDSSNGQLLLIFTPNVMVESGALTKYVDWKRRIGFRVEVVELESLGAPLGSTALRDAVRATEQQRRAEYGERFRYALLIGGNETIPFMTFTPTFVGKNANGNTDLDACDAPIDNSNFNENGIKIKISDWYYADLTSNFDTNNNGCLADGLKTEAANWAPGYIPDARPAMNADVAVGRLPFVQPDDLRKVLDNIVAFERQSNDFKRNTLLGMSYAFLKGRYWDDNENVYKDCAPTPEEKDENGVSKDCKGGTTDLAYLGEYMFSNFLLSEDYNTARYYEAKKAEGAATAIGAQTLTENALVSELQNNNHGFVNLAGHGSASGVFRTYWEDLNSNGSLESPNSSGGQEIKGATLLGNSSHDLVNPANGNGAIYFAAACSTGDPTNPNTFGVQLLREGDGVAWIGGLSMVNVGPWKKPGDGKIQSVNYYVIERLLNRNLRLGEAVWEGLEQKVDTTFDNSADAATALYGDPTLSYWGNPGGQASQAPWPMLRQNNLGQGSTTLPGPSAPITLYSGGFPAPAASYLPPAPILGLGGEIIIATGNQVQIRTLKSSPAQTLNLDATAYGSPALSADGTIYVLDTLGQLYAFKPNLTLGSGPLNRSLRWKINLRLLSGEIVGEPTTPPIIGPDGFVYLSIEDNILAVRPDGHLFANNDIDGNPVGSLAVDGARRVYATTSIGTRYICGFYNQVLGGFFNGCFAEGAFTPTGFYTTAPLLGYGAVYAGRLDGLVQKLNATSLNQQATYQADGMITAGPVGGPGGIVFGTSKGTLYSLNSNLELRWKRSISNDPIKSVPASSSDAIYIVDNQQLKAYNPYSGAPLWSRPLGDGVESGSAAVGNGRRVAVRTNSGLLVLGEDWPAAPLSLQYAPFAASARLRGIALNWAFDEDGTQMANSESELQQASDRPGLLVQRSANGGPWEDVALLPAGTTAYSDTNLLDDTSYRYRVQLLGTDQASDFTVGDEAVQSLPALPAAPTLVAVSATAADGLQLEWTAAAGSLANNYRIERATSAAGPFEPVGFSASNSLIDSGLSQATSYFYRVVALNDSGESPASAVGSGTTRGQSLAAPTNLVAELQADGGIRVSWAAGPAGASAVLEVADGASAEFVPLPNAVADQPYIAYIGEPSSYQFRLKFVSGDNESPYAYSAPLTIAEIQSVYLPMMVR